LPGKTARTIRPTNTSPGPPENSNFIKKGNY
jgi:hypothetical protein